MARPFTASDDEILLAARNSDRPARSGRVLDRGSGERSRPVASCHHFAVQEHARAQGRFAEEDGAAVRRQLSKRCPRHPAETIFCGWPRSLAAMCTAVKAACGSSRVTSVQRSGPRVAAAGASSAVTALRRSNLKGHAGDRDRSRVRSHCVPRTSDRAASWPGSALDDSDSRRYLVMRTTRMAQAGAASRSANRSWRSC